MRLTFKFFFQMIVSQSQMKTRVCRVNLLALHALNAIGTGIAKRARRDASMSDCVIIARRTRMIYGTTEPRRYVGQVGTDKWHLLPTYRHTCIFLQLIFFSLSLVKLLSLTEKSGRKAFYVECWNQ